MRVAILLYQNVKHAPFFSFYEHILGALKNIEYDVIYLDRHPELEEPKDAHHIAIPWIGNNDLKVWQKIITSVVYAASARRVIRKKYDFFIVLTTMPGVLLSDFLCRHYREKYIIDVRDYTKEHFWLYFRAEKKLVSNSCLNIISSPDYVMFLPHSKYCVCHNISVPLVQQGKTAFEKAPGERVIIAYVGIIQYPKTIVKLIELVNDDDRFEFRLYGSEGGDQIVLKYVKELQNPKITMEGSFRSEEKPGIFEKSDLIFNCYGNDNNIVKYAISNKYYDSAYYRKPLLVSPDTTMARLVGKYGFAIDFDSCDNLDELYSWYHEIDAQAFEEYCEHVIIDSVAENRATEEKIIAALESKEN